MQFEFNGNTETIKPLAFSNIRHNIMTLSLYRFWARANVREYLWAKTRLDGEPFEYRGTGDELFKGFWMALLGIFAPFYVVKIAIEFSDNQSLLTLMGLATYFFISFVGGLGIWRARAYILTRTYWRGVNFGLEKRAIRFAFKFVLHSILLAITLGWWHPAMRKSISKDLWSNTYWGNLKFRYSTPRDAKGVYGAFAVGWFGTLFLSIITMIVLGFFMTGFSVIFAEKIKGTSPFLLTLISYLIFAYFWLLMSFCFGSYRAAILRFITKSIHVDDTKIELTLHGTELFGISVKNAFMMIITFGLYAPFMQLRFWNCIINHLSIELPPGGVRTIYAVQHDIASSAEGIEDSFELPLFDMSPV